MGSEEPEKRKELGRKPYDYYRLYDQSEGDDEHGKEPPMLSFIGWRRNRAENCPRTTQKLSLR